MSQLFLTIGRSVHACLDRRIYDNVNENSDISLALDVFLSEHRGYPTEVSFCSVGCSVDFEKDPVSVQGGPTVTLSL